MKSSFTSHSLIVHGVSLDIENYCTLRLLFNQSQLLLGATYFRISLQQSADEDRLQPQRLFLCPDTAVIHLDLHRQSGIIRGLIPAGDLQRVTFQLYDRSVRAPRTK
ncbi:hypothetical protein I5L29_10705 [Serratia marcescens]|uniref:hypothetical protein n=1 Tax=Serratia marcescens TaxID=615 RepID=UPI0018D709AE|nr:hypothetical protein [Serratia marcescens]MBH2772806.1 hypothetical protein [Serratia marcescens]WEE07323.1 hypothetical protein PXW05_15075 [Serratia marcescens]HAV2274490.1 hypothetical protein [Serratia marcescens]